MTIAAGTFGARLRPREVYQFVRGDQVSSNTGQPMKYSRPLDFLVVADHSDNVAMPEQGNSRLA